MTQKKVIIEYLKQCYPEWVLGGNMNRLEVIIDGERFNTGFRGDRNCRDLAQEGKLEKTYNDKGLVMYRYKPEGQTSLLTHKETK